ncbi:hypothetical protein Tco_0098134 [Tanacetum coccineum]
MSQHVNDDFSQHLSDNEASYHEDAHQKMKWKFKRIESNWIKDGVVRILPPVSAAEINAVEKERKDRTILLMAIPKKMQKAVLKQQFEAFTISSSEGLEKGYDRFQQLLSQLEAHGAEVSTEDANHKFLRSLPPAWSNLAMTMRTKPDVDTLSIDDLYNNLRVFEQELTSTSKSSASAQNVAFVSHSKSSNNKVKSGHTEDLDLLHEDLEQIDDVDIEEMDINWQIAMIAIRMKKFYKKTGRRGTNDGKKRDSFYQDQGAGTKEQNQNLCSGNITRIMRRTLKITLFPELKKQRVLNIGNGVAKPGNWITAVKTSAGYNWRGTRPNSNYNSGSNFVRTIKDHPLKNMEDKGIFDSGCSGHMTGNMDHLCIVKNLVIDKECARGKELPEEDFAKEYGRATKDSLKRYGRAFRTKRFQRTEKKQCIDDKDVPLKKKVTEVKREEPGNMETNRALKMLMIGIYGVILQYYVDLPLNEDAFGAYHYSKRYSLETL